MDHLPYPNIQSFGSCYSLELVTSSISSLLPIDKSLRTYCSSPVQPRQVMSQKSPEILLQSPSSFRLAQVGADLHGLIHSLILDGCNSWENQISFWVFCLPQLCSVVIVLEKGKHKSRSSIALSKKVTGQSPRPVSAESWEGCRCQEVCDSLGAKIMYHRVYMIYIGFSLLRYLNIEPIS